MKVLILTIACSIFCVNAISFYELFAEEWHLYKSSFKKNYKNDVEEKFRFKIFLDNKQKVEKHNKKFFRGEVSYKLGLNKFSDMLLHEMVHHMNGYKMTASKSHLKKSNRGEFDIPLDMDLPNSVNWVKEGAVTPIKDQGRCGSCWAFSATGALEGQHFRKTGYLVSLSEQNLIDCSNSEGNAGCSGGQPDMAFSYVIENDGIDTEKSYPYEGVNDICRYNETSVGTTEKKYVDVEPSGSEAALEAAVAKVGPVSVAIDASLNTFFLYKGGIYDDPDCSSTELDHAVLVVGYGIDEETQQPYWLVKNSWGTSWGENGYVKMARNGNNTCGIATAASYPVV